MPAAPSSHPSVNSSPPGDQAVPRAACGYGDSGFARLRSGGCVKVKESEPAYVISAIREVIGRYPAGRSSLISRRQEGLTPFAQSRPPSSHPSSVTFASAPHNDHSGAPPRTGPTIRLPPISADIACQAVRSTN